MASFLATQLNPQLSSVTQSSGSTSLGASSGSVGLGTALTGVGIGLQVAGLISSLSSLSKGRRSIREQAIENRRVATINAQQDVDFIELSAFRLGRTQLAQSASGGFSTRSLSTLSILNRTQTQSDSDTMKRFTTLHATLNEITRQEEAAIKASKRAGVKGIIGTATSILGVVAAPFTGGASLALTAGSSFV